MNERIKELAAQAGATVNERSGYTDYGTLDLDVEKFAQLIVRECAKFLDENSGADECGNVWYPEPEELLKHFGAE